MNVLLSIKPQYANEIINGNKKVEFRKKGFKADINRVYIYSSMPEGKIIGYFTVSDIIEDHPKKLWEQFADVGCIDKESFTEYYANRDKGYSIKVQDVTVYEKPLNPYELIEGFRPPQSFQYVKEEMLKKFKGSAIV